MSEIAIQQNMTAEMTGMFGVVDYTIFGFLMTASAIIGLYFGFCSHYNNSAAEYLIGGRNMGAFPVTMSMIASAISGVTLLGVPTEIYTYGTQYALNALTDILVCTVTAIVFVPVYYTLQVQSTYEYLELRYDKSIRYLLAAIYCFSSNFYMPLVMYVPALALSQVTGVNIFLISSVTTAICVFYTCVGGFRAVVWTDTLQAISMALGTTLVVVLGVIEVGGLGEIFKRANDSGRLEIFNMSLDPNILHTFWSIMIGSFLGWLGGMAGSQPNLQRCLSLPTLAKAQRATIVTSFGSAGFVIFSVFTGLAIYARYYDCDPLFSKAINKSDQILPYFVADIGASIPGVAGLFVAGIFAAALSSLSTTLNSVSAVMVHDLLRPCFVKKQLSELQESRLLKLVVLVLGIITTGLVFLVDKLGTLFQLSRTLGGLTGASRLGIFLFGVAVPWVNAKAVLAGGVFTSIAMAVRVVGMQTALASGDLVFPKKPLSVESCPEFTEAFLNVSINYDFHARYAKNEEQVYWLFRFSYFYNSLISLVIMSLATAVASLVFGVNDPRDMDHRLFSPVVQHFLPSPRQHQREEEAIELNTTQSEQKTSDN